MQRSPGPRAAARQRAISRAVADRAEAIGAAPLLDLLSVVGVSSPTPVWVFAQTVCQLHGFFNGCIFAYYYGGYLRARIADRLWSPSSEALTPSRRESCGRGKHAVFPGGEAFGEGRAEDGNQSPLIDAAS